MHETKEIGKKVTFLLGGSGKYYAELSSGEVVSGVSPIVRRYSRKGDNKAEVISFLKEQAKHPVDEGVRLNGGYTFEVEV